MRFVVLLLVGFSAIALTSLLPGCSDKTTQPKNRIPEVSVTADPDTVDPSGISNVVCVASDPEGGALTYYWNAEAGHITGGTDEVAWALPATPGTYFIEAEVVDDQGGAAADTAYVVVRGGTLLVQSESGLMAVDIDGSYFMFYDTQSEVEVLGTRIFFGTANVGELDHEGNVIGVRPNPPEIPWATTSIVLPDAGMAFINNERDSIYFMGPLGDFVHVIPTPHQSPGGLQSTGGTTVGNSLVMVDTRSDYIFKIDLGTYAVDSLAAVVPGGRDLRDVDYSDGAYYVCRSEGIYRYREGEGVVEVCSIPGANHCAICVVGTQAYVCSCGQDEVYRIDLSTGEYEALTDGISGPEDIEYIPVALEAPGRSR
jgi:hypothetical protein